MAKIELKIKETAKAHGIENPFALQRETGLNYAVCYRLWHETPKQVNLDTLATICQHFKCKPEDLLIFTPDSMKKAR